MKTKICSIHLHPNKRLLGKSDIQPYTARILNGSLDLLKI